MNRNTRIKLTDTPLDSMVKLAEGNPGAITVLMGLMSKGPKIDPQDIMGGLGQILALDSHAIYGSRIWMFYKDVCGSDFTKMIALMRSVQLGIISEDKLNHAIDNYGDGLDINKLHNLVCDRLESFEKPIK